MYAVLLGAGFNMRKLLKAFSWLKFIPQYLTDFSLKKESMGYGIFLNVVPFSSLTI